MISIQRKIQENPFDFEFVPAVMQLWMEAHSNRQTHKKMIGLDHFPSDEFIRFRAQPSLRFSPGQISSLVEGDNDIPEMTVSFIGLVGAVGVLPHHYTQLVIDRVRQGDVAMRDFFDLFHHRIVSYFFRASLKYSLPPNFELSRLAAPGNEDPITLSLFNLAGFGDRSLRHGREFNDDLFLYYGGQFCHAIRTACGLENMLEEFAELPIEVRQFQFEWLYLEPADQSQLTRNSEVRLGESAVLGERVVSFQNRFRVRMGPMDWDTFVGLSPRGARLKSIAQFIKAYVGVALDFDFQLVLREGEIRPLQLGECSIGRLGWSTWLCSQSPAEEVDDPVFELQDI